MELSSSPERRPFPLAISLLLLATAFLLPFSAQAEENALELRPAVQERFAPKEGRFHLHAAATTLIRDDFYDTWGFGFDGGYNFSESWGLELRALKLQSSLSSAAEELRDSQSLVPDLRAPAALILAGGRLSWGYGKILSFNRFVVYFDPQLAIHGGILFAEERIVPTLGSSIGFLGHFRHGIQVKLDLQFSLHLEARNRGPVPSLGFAPILGIGWSPQRGRQ